MKAPRYFSGYTWLAVAAGLAVAVATGWFAVRHFAGDWLNTRLVERYNRAAASEMAGGDAANALVLARRSLQRAPDHVEAWRLAAAAARQRDQPDALYYQENLARVKPTKENEYELIRLALHFGLDAEAVRRVKAIAASATRDPAYLRLAAQAYLRQGNPLAARFHLISLTELAPDDTAARLDLALIDLAADGDTRTPGLRETVRQLAGEPALRVRALTGLLRDSLRSRQVNAGLALMRALEDEAAPAVRLLLLEAAYTFEPAAAPDRLLRLQHAAAARAADASGLIDFMVAHGEASAAVAWAATLPAATRRSEEVRRALTDAHLKLEAWDRLRAVALEGEWPAREFLRRALLAYSYRAQHRRTEFTEAWHGAVQLAGSTFSHTRELLVRVEAWHWGRERFDLLWKLFALLPGRPELRQELAAWEHRQGNTANLRRLYGDVIELAPDDHESRANFAYCSLLLDADVPAAAATFRDLVARDPRNPYYQTGHALALLKEHRAAPALAALAALRPAHLAVPERLGLHAWLLALNGRTDEAGAALAALVTDGLLPEERAWADRAREEVARHRRGLARESLPADGARGNGWLNLVRPAPAPAADTDLRLSDQLLARGDLPALARLVRAGDWRNRDHLRLALLAYSLRPDDPAAAREAWTHALTRARREPDGSAQLESLAAAWGWTAEQIEALGALHQQSPVDRDRLNRLLDHYRDRGRTADLIRVLRPWVERTPDADEAVPFAYYCLLANLETSRAAVAARDALAARPTDADRLLLNAFALARSGRAEEAAALIDRLPAVAAPGLPAPLILAVVWAGAGRTEDAARAAQRFDSSRALPEELALIRKIAPPAEDSP